MTNSRFDEIFNTLGKAVIRDENPAPHDMVGIAAGYLAGDDSDVVMAEEAINYLMAGNYDPAAFVEQVHAAPKVFSTSIPHEVLFTKLCAAMGG